MWTGKNGETRYHVGGIIYKRGLEPEILKAIEEKGWKPQSGEVKQNLTTAGSEAIQTTTQQL